YPHFKLFHLCTFMGKITANVLGLCVRAGFGAQNYQPALNLIRSTKLQVCTSPRLTQNPCYRAFFYSFPIPVLLMCSSNAFSKSSQISQNLLSISSMSDSN